MKTKMLMLLAVLLLIGTTGLGSVKTWSPGNASAPAPSTSYGAPGRWVFAIGSVEPLTEVRRLSFKSNGVIDDCRVVPGREVQQGDVLVSLRNGEEKTAVAVAEQELATARANRARTLAGTHKHRVEMARQRVAGLRERLEYARREAERNRNLAQSSAVGAADNDRTATNLRESTAVLRQAEAELAYFEQSVRPEDRAAADAEVRVAEARLAWRQQQLEDTCVRAPFAGRVLEVVKREGEAIRLADNEPVVLLADMSHIRIRAEIEDRFVQQLRVGQDAVIYGRGLGARTYAGKVTLVKDIMGSKTLFARSAGERKDAEVIQVFIEPEAGFTAPVGLRVDVKLLVQE